MNHVAIVVQGLLFSRNQWIWKGLLDNIVVPLWLDASNPKNEEEITWVL